MRKRIKIYGQTDIEDCIVDPNIKLHNVIPLNKILVIGKDVYYYGEKLPPAPIGNVRVKVFTSDGHIYVNTFEWKNGRWERTWRAFLHFLFG